MDFEQNTEKLGRGTCVQVLFCAIIIALLIVSLVFQIRDGFSMHAKGIYAIVFSAVCSLAVGFWHWIIAEISEERNRGKWYKGMSFTITILLNMNLCLWTNAISRWFYLWASLIILLANAVLAFLGLLYAVAKQKKN